MKYGKIACSVDVIMIILPSNEIDLFGHSKVVFFIYTEKYALVSLSLKKYLTMNSKKTIYLNSCLNLSQNTFF